MLDELGHNPIPLPGWGIKTNLPGKLWPNPILNSNTWVPIPNNIFDWHIYVHVRWTQTQSNTQFQFQGGVSKSICWASYDPIQYPIPIQGYPYRTIFLTVICTCWMNSDPIQYPIPIPGWGIKTNLLGKLWPNPILNSNTWVPIPNNIFDWHMYMLDELTPNPIPNSNSWVGYRNQSAGRAMTQSNT